MPRPEPASHRPRPAAPRLRAGLLLTGLLGVVAVLASTLSPVAAAPARAGGDPNVDRPVVGECHDYSAKELAKPSDPSAPVACDVKHTALTIAVVTPPARLHLDPRHSAAVARAVGRQCYAAVDATLGGSARLRAKTAYSYGFFLPTKSELAQGARWVRCDLILRGGRRLSPLPTPLLGSLTDATQRCLLLVGNKPLTTSCNRAHGYRSTRTVTLHGKAYPSVRALQTAARRSCALRAGVGWFATWPDAFDWKYGHQRQLVCYRQTSS